MQDEDFQKIKEAGWRRALDRDEDAALQSFLAAHPEAKAAWSEEAALNQLLQRLPAAPVSSNFTARLMQAVPTAPPRRTWRDWFAPAEWLPANRSWRVAMCSMIVASGLFSFHEYQALYRIKMARQLASVSRMATLPPVDWLKDFDTINKINQVKVADDDLLAALQ